MKRLTPTSQFVLTCVAILGLSACSKPSTESSDEAQAENTSTPPAGEATPVEYASLTGNAAAGEAAFTQCKVCHALEEGKVGLGPSLHKIIGQPAGSVAGYSYSTGMKASGLTWTEDKIFAYIEKPQTVVPGTKMSFAGYPDPQKRADLIAWLKANGGS